MDSVKGGALPFLEADINVVVVGTTTACFIKFLG